MPEIQIDNPADSRLDEYRDIGDPASIRQRGLFVAEGRLVVRRMLESRRFQPRSVLVSTAACRDLRDALETWPEVPVYVCRADAFLPVTGFDIHRGCLALVERPVPQTPAALIEAAKRLILLEGVANPDNVGGVFRNAAAFGVDGVLLTRDCSDPFYRKAIRTSMAAVLGVPFAYVESWPDQLSELRQAGFLIVAFTPDRGAQTLDEFAGSATGCRLACLFGGEGTGLSAPAMALADSHVRIPIRGGVDSLNLAVASGIAMSRLTNTDDLE
jgi:tRNA G18 (ribose-2'-O)-methylase SpoU